MNSKKQMLECGAIITGVPLIMSLRCVLVKNNKKDLKSRSSQKSIEEEAARALKVVVLGIYLLKTPV